MPHRFKHATKTTLAHLALLGVLMGVCCQQLAAQGIGGSGFGPDIGGKKAPTSGPPVRAPIFTPLNGTPVGTVTIVGRRNIPEARILSMLGTRADRTFDPEQVQRDVRTLMNSGLFHDVRTYKQETPDGRVNVSFEVVERATIGHVRFVGNKKIKVKHLQRESNLKPGDAMNRYAVEEGRRRIQQFYKTKGFTDATVTIVEGDHPDHAGVTYEIAEGTVRRIFYTKFEGNEIASDARLRTQIESKPGWFYVFGGKVNGDELQQDELKLTNYYRALGFFKAEVHHQISFDEKQQWATVTFHINEGPRYKVRNVIVEGNQTFTTPSLMAQLKLQHDQFYNLGALQTDLNQMRDMYGSQGYVFADVQAEPRFFEQPGMVDLVYKIDEGDQYRVGNIYVNIDGEHSRTRRNVVLNRLSVKPGDIVDIREIRKSERRLQSSQLFMHEPARGITPKIAIKPLPDDVQVATDPRPTANSDTFRGQSPSGTTFSVQRPIQQVAGPFSLCSPRALVRQVDLWIDVQSTETDESTSEEGQQ